MDNNDIQVMYFKLKIHHEILENRDETLKKALRRLFAELSWSIPPENLMGCTWGLIGNIEDFLAGKSNSIEFPELSDD